MPQHKLIDKLTPSVLLFPLALVLYELATYISNDMVLPAMPGIVNEYGADPALIPSTVTLCILGGASLQWLLGPLSDRIGRRPVMLFGVVMFIASCIGILFSPNFEVFLAFRFLQGVGMCFLASVGYAAIQESFAETAAIRVTALMANVSLIAPMAGPLAGAILITLAHWHAIFLVVAAIAAIALAGLYFAMPETSPRIASPLSVRELAGDYRQIFSNRHFVTGVLALGLTSAPLLGWISLSPVILIHDAALSTLDYGLWQLPVFGGLILGNLILARLVDRYPVTTLIKAGTIPQVLGIALSLKLLLTPDDWAWLSISLGVAALGMGMVNAALYRQVLFASQLAKGTVAAALGMLNLLIFSLGIELLKYAHAQWGNASFVLICAIMTALAVWARVGFLHTAASQTEESDQAQPVAQSA